MTEQSDIRVLTSPYKEWVKAEGVPVHSGFSVDMRSVDVANWPRFGVKGAVIDVAGRGDYVDLWLLEIPPAQELLQQQHLFESIVYVISGHGTTVIEGPQGQYSLEWGEKSMFVLPLNCRYRMFNTSGTSPARIAMTTTFPIMMNVIHNSDFIFGGTSFTFEERFAAAGNFDGTGEPGSYHSNQVAHNFWVTNFVPDLGKFDELKDHGWRGKGAKSVMFIAADGVLQAHISEIPVSMYKQAHRHMAGTHIFPVTGKGYTLLWEEGNSDYRRVDWEHGVVYAPPDAMYHQHFNVSTEPSRYFAISFGSYRYPTLSERAAAYSAQGYSEAAKERKTQIPYENEDPAIRALYVKELTAAGLDNSLSGFN